jgi:hypothetical protein
MVLGEGADNEESRMNPAEYFLAAIKADPNLLDEFKRHFSPEWAPEAKAEAAREAKREEKRQDGRDEALWRLRGGRDEA